MTGAPVPRALDKRPAAPDPSDFLGARPPSRRALAFTSLLLFAACLPDAMLPPVLKALVIDRLGATAPQAHWFMSINLLGALGAIPLLAALRRRSAPALQVAVAAAANALLLLGISFSTSFAAAMALRALEGVADMIAFAVLLDLTAKAGGTRTQGRRLGVATTVLMLGLASGALLGGRIGDPTTVLAVGAAACAAVALLAISGRRLMRRSVASCPAVEVAPIARERRIPLWTVALMMGSDRMLGGLLTVTIPLLLTARMGWPQERVGGFLAVPLLLMALGAYPAGRIADRVGNLYARSVAALVYAAALAVVPIVGGASPVAIAATLLVLGAAASALMPTGMALAARTGKGAVAMASGHAAGSIGYALGIAGAGAMLAFLGGPAPSHATYTMVIQLFALLHVTVTGIALVEARWGAAARSDLAAESLHPSDPHDVGDPAERASPADSNSSFDRTNSAGPSDAADDIGPARGGNGERPRSRVPTRA
ncbi:MAG TPA: MFS transporter [Phycisphaerales bacterium]|nr:MFS transporter [Phycisphaerales bacterium]HMP36862.1 MFS transporter [Phycisphaerales bacterium]